MSIDVHVRRPPQSPASKHNVFNCKEGLFSIQSKTNLSPSVLCPRIAYPKRPVPIWKANQQDNTTTSPSH